MLSLPASVAAQTAGPSTLAFLSSSTFNAGAGSSHTIQGMYVSASSDVFVTGSAKTGGSPLGDLWIARFSPQGVLLSSATRPDTGGDDTGRAIYVRDNGEVYVVGAVVEPSGGESNAYIARYDQNLALVVSTTVDGPASRQDTAFALDFNGTSLFVTGQVDGNTGTERAWVAKYDVNLVLISSGLLPLAGSAQVARAIRVDAAGSVFVAGNQNNGNADILVAKLSPDLVQVAVKTFAGTGDSTDYATGVDLFGNGEIVVTGWMNNSPGGDDVWVARLSTGSLGVVNSQGFDLGSNERGHSVVVDAGGNIFVAGLSNALSAVWVGRFDASLVLTSSAAYGPGNFLGERYDIRLSSGAALIGGTAEAPGSGQEAWVGRFGAAAGGGGGGAYAGTFANPSGASYDDVLLDQGSAVFVDTVTGGGPYVYVVGESSSSSNDFDILVVKYDAAGNVLSSFTFNAGANTPDVGRDILKVPGGDVFVAGSSFNGAEDFLVLKLSPTLAFLSSASYDGGASDWASGMALDNSGNLFVTGASSISNLDFITFKYDQNLVFLASAAINGAANMNDDARDVVVNETGEVFVVGQYVNGANGDFWVVKYDQDLNFLSSATYDAGSGEALDGAVVANNALYVTGEHSTFSNILTIKYDFALNVVSSASFNGTGNGTDDSNAIVADSSGNIIVAGRSRIALTDDYVLVKYDPSLVFQASHSFNGAGNGSDIAFGLGVDAAGNVYATGRSFNGTSDELRTIRHAFGAAAGGGGSGFNFVGADFDSGIAFRSDAGVNETGDYFFVDTATSETYVVYASSNNDGSFDGNGHALVAVKRSFGGAFITSTTLLGDQPGAYALDANGFYVAAENDPGGAPIIARYDRNLVFQSSRTYGMGDVGHATALLSDGAFLYMAAEGGDFSNFGAKIVRYDATTLAEVARTTYTLAGQRHHIHIALGNGEIFAVVSTGTVSTLRLLKYPSGLPATPAVDRDATSFTGTFSGVYRSGPNLYLVNASTGGELALFIHRFDQNLNYAGNSSTFTPWGSSPLEVGVDSVDFDAAGDLYIVGTTSAAANRDYLALRYGPTLNFKSSATLEGGNNDNDHATGVGVLSEGQLLAAGARANGSESDGFVAKMVVSAGDSPNGLFSGAFGNITDSGFTANWTSTHPAGTFYLAEISSDGFASVLASSFTANTFADFLGLAPLILYQARVAPQGSGIATDLGQVQTGSPAGEGFTGLAFHPSDGWAWAALKKLNEVRRYAAPLASPVQEGDAPNESRANLIGPRAAAFDGGNNLWVAVATSPSAPQAAELVRFDSTGASVSGSTTASLSVLDARSIAFRSSNGDMWVAKDNSGGPSSVPSIVVFNNLGSAGAPVFNAANMSTHVFKSDFAAPLDLAFDTGGRLWAASRAEQKIVRYGLSGGVIQVSTSVTLSGVPDPYALAFDPASGSLFVSGVPPGAPSTGKLYKFQNIGTLGSPSFSSSPVVLQSDIALADLAFNSQNELWGADFDSSPSKLVKLSTGVTQIAQFGVIRGTVAYNGTLGGAFLVAISTSPSIEDGDAATQVVPVSTGSGGFIITDVIAPNTYYVVAALDTNGDQNPEGFEPLTRYSTSPPTAQATPVFVGANQTALGINIHLLDMAATTGTITNNSLQSGNLRVQLWAGPPDSSKPGRLVTDRFLGSAQSTYSVTATTGTDFYVRVYVDGDNSGVHESGEDAGVSGPFSNLTPGTTVARDISIAFSAGGILHAATEDIAPNTADSNGKDLAMMVLKLWSSGGNAQFNKVRAGLLGSAPSANVSAKLFRDSNNDGALQLGTDELLGSQNFQPGAPPKAEVQIATQTVSATTQQYLIAFDLFGVPAGNDFAAVIDQESDIVLTLGSPAGEPGVFPAESSFVLVSVSLAAHPPSGGYPDPTSSGFGGFDTGLFVQNGQTVLVSGQGSWNTGSFGPSGPAGLGSTGGLSAGFPIGALVGRIGGSSWFVIGASASVTASGSGNLYLAMNDTNYGDNFGSIAVDFQVQASTVVRVWIGGTAGFENSADFPNNWQGGLRPASGESIRLDGAVSNLDVNWDIFGADVGLLEMTTSYTGTFRQFDQFLKVSSNLVVGGGRFELGANHNLEVAGQARITGGTFEMGQDNAHLRVSRKGVVVDNGGLFKSRPSGFVTVEPIDANDRIPFDVFTGTVDVKQAAGTSGLTQFDNLEQFNLSSAAVVAAFDNAKFFYYSPYSRPTMRLSALSPISRSFRDIYFHIDVSTNVDASGVVAGSTITFTDALGARFGTPFEKDPNNVVTWLPDGGGVATASGSLVYSGSQGGSFLVRASTSPQNDPGALGTDFGPSGANTYSFTSLSAPNTWYFFAFKDPDGDSQPNGFNPRGGHQNPGVLRSGGVFLLNGSNQGGIDVVLEDPGAVEGNITVNTDQVGPLLVAAIPEGDPASVNAQEEVFGSFYTLFAKATDYTIVAFVDVNGNRALDESFEASGTVSNVAVPSLSSATGVNITVQGGQAPPGGVASVTPSVAHGGFLGANGQFALLKLEIFANTDAVTLNQLRFDLSGSAPPGSYSVQLYRDGGNGQFDGGGGAAATSSFDEQVAFESLSGGVSSGTLSLFSPQQLPADTSGTFFLTADMQGQSGVGFGLQVAASSYFGLSQGAMASQGIYPIDSGTATVRFAVPASQFVDAPNFGGVGTGFFADAGQTLTVTATGQWKVNFADATSPAGQAGTSGFNTVLPGARRGELIGRVGSDPESSWFRVGTSTTRVLGFGGELFLGMNDFPGDYFDNSGEVFASFSLSGSTTGAIQGQVGYVGSVTSGNLRVRANKCDAQTFGQETQCFAVSTQTISITGGTTFYGYTLGGLAPGEYKVDADLSADPAQRGGSFGSFQVGAGSTRTGVNFDLALGLGSISGNLSYSGVQPFGDFLIAASTTSDFEREVIFLGKANLSAPGAYTLSNLPSPNTYYIVAFRDGNFDFEPEGPEPFGVVGNSDGPISDLSSLFTPVFVDTGAAVTGQNITLLDRGAITGNLFFPSGFTDKPVVALAVRGRLGEPGAFFESGEFSDPATVPNNGNFSYRVGLLRPATDYSVFAFVDSNFSGEHDSSEPFAYAEGPFSVFAGGDLPVDMTVNAPQPPPAVQGFAGKSTSTVAVEWSWSSNPGADDYRLLSSTGGVLAVVAAPATSYIDYLAPNATSQIRGIRALNAQGSGSSSTFAGAPVASLAAIPGVVNFSAIAQSSMTLNWATSGNSAATLYELARGTQSGGPFVPLITVSGPPLTDNSLAPSTEYFYQVRAKNQNNIFSAYAATTSQVTASASGAAISGLVSYAGRQSGSIVVAAHLSSSPFGAASASVQLPNAAVQPYFLPGISAGTYFLRAFVDVDADGAFDAGEDWGSLTSGIAVAGAPNSGNDFTVSVDTVAPAQPFGLAPTISLGRVDLTWNAPAVNADGSVLNDFAGYRVWRSTNNGANYQTLSTSTIKGATGTVAGTAFADLSPVGGVVNLYQIIAVDYGQNESQRTTAISVRPSVGGTISGTISTHTASTAIFRVRLSTTPQRNVFTAQTTLSPFSFKGLSDGVYYLRGFFDANGDGSQDAGSEPSGTFGGIASPYPIQIIGGNAVSSQTVTMCDRTSIKPGPPTSGTLSATDCPALDAGSGRFADLYTFRVGGGAQGSVAPGSNIHVGMFAPFETQLFLLGPSGNVVAQNSDPFGAFIDTTLNQQGLYIIEATSFGSGQTGGYDLDFFVAGGFGGTISGDATYSGGQTGQIHIQLFDTPDETNNFPFFVQTLPNPGAFSLPNLPDGVFYLRAFMDSDGNGVKGGSEPSGVYGLSASSPTAIQIFGGVVQQGSLDVTLSDPAVGAVEGQVSRDGSLSGTIRVDIGKKRCAECSDLDVVAFATMSAAGSYALRFIPPSTSYVLLAYVDQNNNNNPDPLEAVASSSPVRVTANSTTTLNILVRDPGFGSSGNSTVKGTVTYSGSSTGTVLIGIASDPDLTVFPYFLQLASTGSYTKSGIVGNTSYYLGVFIDVNGNGQPDFDGDFIEPAFGDGTPLFVPTSSTVVRNLALQDPPGGVISGTVTYNGSAFGTLIVETNSQSGQDEGAFRKTLVAMIPGVSTYSYTLKNLAALSDFRVRAFVDSNGNERGDFGEPFFERASQVSVSSGTGAAPSAGIDLFLFDAGAGGATGATGRLSGTINYNGGQPGPMVVQVFTTSTFAGASRYEQDATGGPSVFTFDFNNVANGTYYLRAFKDPNFDRFLDPAFEANGVIDGGAAQAVSSDAPIRQNLIGTVTDVGTGTGGSNVISGNVTYRGTKHSSGTIRVVLFRRDATGSQTPARISTFAFTTSPVAYNFTVDPGQYFPRAFMDLNDNFFFDSEEGCGGASGQGYFAPGAPPGINFEICDRAPINTSPGVVTISTLTVNDCRSDERPERPFVKKFQFAGGRGQVVTIEMEATGFFDSYLYLYDPLGALLTEDDESAGNGNARILNFKLPKDGIYTIGATSFAGGQTGAFKLKFQGSSGDLGSISGDVTYSGSQGGRIIIGLFNNQDFDQPNAFVDGRELPGPGAFSFGNLASGTSYYIGGFIDTNFNFDIDPGEDSDIFGTGGVPTAIFLRSGQNVGGVNFDIKGTTDTAGLAGITGLVSYTGSQTGTMRMEFWVDGTFQGRPVAVRSDPTGAGFYDVTLPGGQPYFIRAFLDTNNNFLPDSVEPKGVYGTEAGAEPVFVPVSGTINGIDFEMFEPGKTRGQEGLAGEGRASVSPSAVSAGQFLPVVASTVVIEGSGIGTNGVVAFGPPPGFTFPQTFGAGQPGYVTAAATNKAGWPAVTLSLEQPPGQPGVLARVTSSTPLVAGATVLFTYTDVSVPCFAPENDFFLATASTGTIPPAPLFNGLPEMTIGAGQASFFQIKGGYFALTQGTTGEVVLEAVDNCGRLAQVASAKTAYMRAKSFDFSTGIFGDEGALKFSTSTTGQFGNTLDFAFGTSMSSRTFLAVSTKTGDLSVEIFSNLQTENTFYAGLTVHAGNLMSNVSVSTTAFEIGKTSVTITPNGDLSADLAFINFDMSQQVGWAIAISSVPFKSGTAPNPIYQSWGFGQPARGQIVWDGRFNPWINNGGRVPSGAYYVRIDLGGVRNDALRIDVESTQLTGQILDAGVTPNIPLSGVGIDVFGNTGGQFAQTNTQGNYTLPGLAAGQYKMVFRKSGYLIGNATVTLNASAQVTGFGSSDANVTLSSTSAGALNVKMNRAPALVVTPTITSSQTVELWGGLQVHNASFTRVFDGPLHLAAGTTTFDDGGQWDPSVQRFVTKTKLRFEVPSDTYTIRAFLPGYDELVLTGQFVGSGQKSVTLSPFSQRSVVIGTVTLPTGFNTQGTFVSVNAVNLSTSAGAEGGFGGVFLTAGVDTGTYRVEGLRAGDYSLVGNAPGLAAVKIASVTVGSGVQVSTDLPAFANPNLANVVTGTITVVGNTTGFGNVAAGVKVRAHVNAWAPGTLNFGQTTVDFAGNAASEAKSFRITGLTPGATYQIFTDLEFNSDGTVEDFTSPGGFPKLVLLDKAAGKNAEGSLDFSFEAASGAIQGVIFLPSGSADFGNVDFFGRVVESADPTRVGEDLTDGQQLKATGLPNFKCGDGSNPDGGGNCPVSVASFTVQGLNTETYQVQFVYNTNGKVVDSRIPVVSGATTTATVDLRILDVRSSTYSISGSILNQINNSFFNTNAKITANAAQIPLRDVYRNVVPFAQPAGLSVSTRSIARVIAIQRGFDEFGVAISTSFDKTKMRVGWLHESGTFTITNVPAGIYVLRTEDLKTCATCGVLVPQQTLQVVVTTFSRVDQNLTLSDGFSAAGSIVLDDSIADSANFTLTLRNSRQAVVRSTRTSLGSTATGATANSVAYSFTNLPAGEFYTLDVKDSSAAPKYVGKPIQFPDPGISPAGLQASLTGQNVTMKQAAYITGKLKDAGTGEQIRASNATRLPPNFQIYAVANPWVEGGFVLAASSISNRPIRGDGTFLVGPLFPDTPYDLNLKQEKWDLAFLAQGSQNYSPVLVGGLKMKSGETKDAGTIDLNQGTSLKGALVDKLSTSTALGNIKITAKPSFGNITLNVQTFTNSAGEFTLWVSTFVSPEYDLLIAPRDGGNQAASGKVYETLELFNVTVTTARINSCPFSTTTICLQELLGSVTAQIVTADGGALAYPFGEKKGFPAAAVFLQERGVVPVDNPLGDIETVTAADGLFELTALSTGTYDLKAASLGYSVYNATVVVSTSSFNIIDAASGVAVSSITLRRGAQVTGRIVLSNGSAPSSDEITGVAAASRDFSRFVVGSVESDKNARTVSNYTITGFETGVVYDIVILTGEGEDVVLPTEGQGISFMAAESTTTKSINLTFRRTAPDCTATSKNIGNFQFQIKVDCTEPLRSETSADKDLDAVLSKSTATSLGAALTSPNGTGLFLQSDKAFENGRKQITAIYRANKGVDGGEFTSDDEQLFSLKLAGAFNTVNPATGEKFTIEKVFDFSTRLASAKTKNVSNMQGGKVKLEPTDEDRLKGLDERFSVTMPAGGLKKCVAGDSNCTVDGSLGANTGLNVQVQVRKSTQSVDDAEVGTSGSFSGLSAADISPELARVRELKAAATVAKAQLNPLSAFYAIFLPANIAHQLGKPADITLSYNSTAPASSLNVYFYDTTLGAYTKEEKNKRVDTQNKTVTVTVDHFSTFVVSDSSPIFTGANPFNDSQIHAFNFPNPFDCVSKTVSVDPRFGTTSLTRQDGTIVGACFPNDGTPADEWTLRIYNIAGELVREMTNPSIAGGKCAHRTWSCENQSGKKVSSGVYIGQVDWNGRKKFFKMALIKGSGL